MFSRDMGLATLLSPAHLASNLFLLLLLDPLVDKVSDTRGGNLSPAHYDAAAILNRVAIAARNLPTWWGTCERFRSSVRSFFCPHSHSHKATTPWSPARSPTRNLSPS